MTFSAILLFLTSIIKIFADSGYRGPLLDWVDEVSQKKATLEIVAPPAELWLPLLIGWALPLIPNAG